jgi:hypothetical protein
MMTITCDRCGQPATEIIRLTHGRREAVSGISTMYIKTDEIIRLDVCELCRDSALETARSAIAALGGRVA